MYALAIRKTVFLVALAAMLAIPGELAWARPQTVPVAPKSKSAAKPPAKKDSKKKEQTPPKSEDDLYLGEDWEEQNNARRAGGKANADDPKAATSQPQSIWVLVLGTFSGEGHETAAVEMLANLPKVAPQVRGARIHTTPRGSMVIYGNYTSRDDANAKADQELLKKIQYNGMTVFNRVLLTRIDNRWQGKLHPYDLLNARKQHPKVNPLYTLDVAIWMTNTDPKAGPVVTYDQVRSKAEAYATELRTRGEEAYFYHDDEQQWSIVSIGLFDHRAIHPESQLFSDDVMRVIKRFPKRTVNGEELIVLKNAKKPQEGGMPQQPKLVMVPAM